jgi:hypothetical protein
MKKYFILLLTSLMFTVSGSYAQNKKGQSDRKIESQVGKFKFAKVSRDTKKEAKKYDKDGYVVFAGSLPMKNQLDKSYRLQSETDDEGFPKWIIANGTALGQTQGAAEMQATELAKLRLVGLLETNMRSVVESDVSNSQLSTTDATSVQKTIEVATNRVAKKLTRVMPLFKVHKNIKKNVEVKVQIGYNYDLAKKAMLDEMRLILEEETEDVRKKHDAFLNPDKYRSGEIKNYSGGSELQGE